VIEGVVAPQAATKSTTAVAVNRRRYESRT
jgi:hypothetical protein